MQKFNTWWRNDKLIIGKVENIQPHPYANVLMIVTINHGQEVHAKILTTTKSITKHKNLSQERLPILKVPFSRLGGKIVDANSSRFPKPFKKVRAAKFRGLRSFGNVLSERELGISDFHDDIFLFPKDAPIGMSLKEYLGEKAIKVTITEN